MRVLSTLDPFAGDVTDRERLQAEMMKKDRLASVGMLAAGIAHELNNPLTALSIQLELLRARPLGAEEAAAFEQMCEATERMRSIIADLLFMARPSEHPQMHVDVAKILASSVQLLRAGTPSCPPIELAMEPLPAVQAYASKLGQVFLNVLRNAVEAVESIPAARVSVLARAIESGIEIRVADNGHGVSDDVLARIAQPFFTTKPNGSGLGLWISHSLVALHGGTLDLVSREGEGTEVRVWVPLTLRR